MYKVSSLIVDLVLSFWQRIPGPVIHNLEKAWALKKLFWHLNVDGISGAYLEFGVAHGHSMRSAQIGRRLHTLKSLESRELDVIYMVLILSRKLLVMRSMMLTQHGMVTYSMFLLRK